LDRDQEPRLRPQAPYEHRFYELVRSELGPQRWAAAAALAVLSLGLAVLAGAAQVPGLALVLAAHELAHLAVAWAHRLSLGPPLFVPFFPSGTLGSLLGLRAPFKTRRDQFDLALAGPAAGGLASLGLLAWAPATFEPGARLGLLLSFLHLLPGGPFDGALLGKALAGRRRLWLAGGAATLLASAAAYVRDPWWLAWSAVCLLPQRRFPPPLNPFLGLGPLRWGIAGLALGLAVACAASPRGLFIGS
jgi:hypothetical protein